MKQQSALADVNCHSDFKMTSVMALDSVTLFQRLKDVINACKRMRNSPVIAGFLQCNGGKLEEAEDVKCVFAIFEIDLL